MSENRSSAQVAPPADVRFADGLELDRAIRRLAIAEQRRMLEEAAAVVRERMVKHESVTPTLAPLDELPEAGNGWLIVGWVVAVGGTNITTFPVRWHPTTGQRRIATPAGRAAPAFPRP